MVYLIIAVRWRVGRVGEDLTPIPSHLLKLPTSLRFEVRN